MLTADVRDAPPAEAVAYWRAAGWSEERIAEEAAKGWGRFAAMVSPVPVGHRPHAGRRRDRGSARGPGGW